MRKIFLGIGLGFIVGILDVIPMVLMNLPWSANLSAFAQWIVAGFIISTSNLNLNPALKGLIISLILLIPIAILAGAENPMNLIPMVIMTIILGSLLGFAIEKLAA